jgi:hypothetical protein
MNNILLIGGKMNGWRIAISVIVGDVIRCINGEIIDPSSLDDLFLHNREELYRTIDLGHGAIVGISTKITVQQGLHLLTKRYPKTRKRKFSYRNFMPLD